MPRVSKFGFLLLAALCCGSLGAYRQAHSQPLRVGLPSFAFSSTEPQFAIADFDGDRQPDLVTLEIQHAGSRLTQYLIRFRLASGSGQALGLSTAFGGLQIVPRDVNGDNAMDIVVSTPGLQEPVAVLLNDGHGNFRVASPASFPFKIEPASSQWSGLGIAVRDRFALAGDGPSLAHPQQEDALPQIADSSRRVVQAISVAPISSRLRLRFGRAPPALS